MDVPVKMGQYRTLGDDYDGWIRFPSLILHQTNLEIEELRVKSVSYHQLLMLPCSVISPSSNTIIQSALMVAANRCVMKSVVTPDIISFSFMGITHILLTDQAQQRVRRA